MVPLLVLALKSHIPTHLETISMWAHLVIEQALWLRIGGRAANLARSAQFLRNCVHDARSMRGLRVGVLTCT